MAPTLFLSDLHLSPERPAAGRGVPRASARARRATPPALYVLGDLFDWWIGDDQLRDPFAAARRARRCASIADAGVPLFVAPRQPRLPAGRALRARDRRHAAAGADRASTSHGTPTLLCHGDELCTDDVEYQAYRARIAQDPRDAARLLALPYFVRRGIAAWLRRAAAAATALKPESIMDVNADAVVAAFARARRARG